MSKQEKSAFKGFGYLEFSSVEEAKNAVDALNGQNISGRAIRLDYSQPRDNAAGGGGRGGTLYLKIIFLIISFRPWWFAWWSSWCLWW